MRGPLWGGEKVSHWGGGVLIRVEGGEGVTWGVLIKGVGVLITGGD